MAIERFDCKNSLVGAMHSGINLFVGAGFSVYAKDKTGRSLPTASQLIDELHINVGPGQKELSRYCSVMEKKNKGALEDYLTERFTVFNYDDCYLNLNLINLKGVYTTNIDDLVPQVIERSELKYINYQHTNGDCIDERGVNYLPLHGYVKDQEKRYIFSVEKIANIYHQAARIWSYLSAALEKYPTVFIGYGLNDTGVIESLTSERTFQNAQKAKWIVLYKPTADDIEYFESMGFNIVIADTKEFLDAIATLDEWDEAKGDGRRDIEELLSAYIIPKDTRRQIQRPIEDFYRGLQPTWTDILRNVIYKTSHYKSIEDSIFNKQKGTIIIGSPISGKTTLSMQVGYFIQYSGVKLFFTGLNQQRANYISKIIGDQKVLLVVENFTDDIQAFQGLRSLPNVSLVGVDRSHNFGYVSHLIEGDKFDIINVTPLTEFDIQGIVDTIPYEIKKSEREIRKRRNQHDTDVSIFELVIRHIKGKSVKKRYKEFIEKLEADDVELAEFLVLCAYMHAARVPLSMEVAFSYFDDFCYMDVIGMRDQLADFLKEDEAEELAHNNIDGYRPRSSITSEAILSCVSSRLFAKVLNTLIDKVSYVEICNFKTFRKWAFDKSLILKAFPNWEEGKRFYEKAFLFDNRNPYVLQQGALYLSSQQKYQEAFDWIDKAKNLTNDRQFSIRNSHAIIMFDANYNIDTDEAEEQLDRSMEILHKCFNDDMRKTFHAKTYADQALRYYRKYNNAKSIEYLQQSLVWLEQEKAINTWASDLQSYVNKVRKVLSM